MNHLEVGRKMQQIRGQYRYGYKKTGWVCLQNISDYSPFGAPLDGRTIQGDFYRRGFNGMEKDDEMKGSENSYTTEFRFLDPRLGRWLSVDPLSGQFSWQSPYCSFDNNPIFFNDPNGLKSKGNGDPPGLPAKKTESDGSQRDWQVYDDFKDVNGDLWTLSQKGENSTIWQRVIIVSATKNAGKINNDKVLEEAPKTKSDKILNSETPWMDTALKEKASGVKEEPNGSNSGPKVNEYLKFSGVSSPNQWCAAFVNWCLGQNGIKGAGAVGNNYKKWGLKIDNPKYGSIAIFKTGHVGFYMETMPNGNYKIIHGNWANRVEISDYIKPNEINMFVFPKK